MCRWSGIRYGCGSGYRATAAHDRLRAGSVRPQHLPAGPPGWSTTRRCARYILRRLMIDRATVAAVARELGLSWDTVNTIAMDATQHDRGRRHHPAGRGARHRR